MEKNQATFGKLKYGLHGQPLPNFFYKNRDDTNLKSSNNPIEGDVGAAEVIKPQTTIEWWKKTGNYKDKPTHTSTRELNVKKKYWAKPDVNYLTELKSEQPPLDDFKKGRIIKLKMPI